MNASKLAWALAVLSGRRRDDDWIRQGRFMGIAVTLHPSEEELLYFAEKVVLKALLSVDANGN